MKSITLFLFIVLATSSFAYDKDAILKDYAAKKYKKICLESAYFYKNGGKDENLLSLIGDSCVKSDFINPLGYIVKNLISTPQARQNASYFSTILLQKKLIYQFVNDGLDLKNLRLPKTEHILSIVFENLVKNNYLKNEEIYTINYDKIHTIVLYKKLKDDNSWVVIEEYKNGELNTRHWYI
jgi:hypothetical protein